MSEPTLSLDSVAVIAQLESAFGIPQFRPQDAEGQVHLQPDLLAELVGTILSQNTSDLNSSRAFASLKARFSTWEAVMNAPLDQVADAIRSGGLANLKAARIQTILGEILHQQGCLSLEFLAERSDLEALDYLTHFRGVGLKTAACVLMFGLGRDLCPVDTHVHRLANRLGLVTTRHADATFTQLAARIPAGKAYSLHINLIRLGKRVCKAQKPICLKCPLLHLCPTAAGSTCYSRDLQS